MWCECMIVGWLDGLEKWKRSYVGLYRLYFSNFMWALWVNWNAVRTGICQYIYARVCRIHDCHTAYALDICKPANIKKC